jgi:hypothetical protein
MRLPLECWDVYTVEYEDEDFGIGQEVVRVSWIADGNIFPEIRGKITHIYRDGIRIEWNGLAFLLPYSTYGLDWLYVFDFSHLEYIVKATYLDTNHIKLLIEGWGERLVLAAAMNAGHSVSLKVIEICWNN